MAHRERLIYAALMSRFVGVLAALALVAVVPACKKSSANTETRAPVDLGPRASAKIGGTSISDVKGADIQQALKEQAWSPGGATVSTSGPMEVLSSTADNGPLHATISVVRPRTTPGPSRGRAPTAKEQERYFAPKAATLLDDPVLVAVAIQGHKDDAEKLLAGLVQR